MIFSFRFFVPLQVYDLLVNLDGCKYGNQSGCVVNLNVRGQGLPGPKLQTVSKACSESETDCVLTMFHPEVNSWNYLEIQSTVDEELTASLSFVLKGLLLLLSYSVITDSRQTANKSSAESTLQYFVHLHLF